MTDHVAGWVLARERQALRRVRFAGLAAVLVLCMAAGWLVWREVNLSGLDVRTGEAVAGQDAGAVLLDLKRLSMVIYLAKVRSNAFLMDITGSSNLEYPCSVLPDMRGLPGDSSCAAGWDKALSEIWKAAYGPDAPPIPERLKRDPWGSPYLLSKGEIICGMMGTWCPNDIIRSAGPDGKADTPDDIQATVPQHLGPERVQQAQ